MEADKEFSSTMRIDIPPDLIQKNDPKTVRLETRRLSPTRKVVIKIPRGEGASQESKYQQLLQSIYDAVLVTDLRGHIVDSNLRASEFLMFSGDELNRMTILDILSGADESLFDMLRDNLQNERYALLQAYCVCKDESFFPAEIAVNLLKFEETRLCFFIRDVTVRKEAEEKLKTEHNAIQNSGNGIAIADHDGRLAYVNPALLRLWGYAAGEELYGMDARKLWVDSSASRELMQTVLADHLSWSGELMACRKDGSRFDVQISAACNRDTDGEPVGMVVSFVDISDRKRAEEAVHQSERQKAMLASLGAACHHLGQPSTVILANLGLMQRLSAGVSGELKELIDATAGSAEVLAKVLYKLNTINCYETTQYLDTAGGPETTENTILKI